MQVSTQGLASYTPKEISVISGSYKSPSSDTHNVIKNIISGANNAINKSPHPYETIVTSGSGAKTGEPSNTGAISHEASDVYKLALAYGITGDASYFNHAKTYLLDWAKINVPSSDSIANAALMPMFKAYDLIRGQFSSADKAQVDHWLGGIADALIEGHNNAMQDGSLTAVNNHHSWQLLEVGTIGATLGSPDYIHYVTDGFLSHIGNNLKSTPGEEPYLGVDYAQRHAYHYVAYNLEALGNLAILMDRIGHLPENPYGISYNPFTVEVGGASIQHTLEALLPYASGEKHSLHEFQGSGNPNDAIRLDNGSLNSAFNISDALPAVQAADYFGHTANDPFSGHSYNLAKLAADILENADKTPLSGKFPTENFLANNIESPYYAHTPSASAGNHTAAMTTIKVTPYDGDHIFDAGSGNDMFTFYKHTGHTTIQDFGGNDALNISSKIYSSAEQALSHVQYSDGNAIIPLDKGNSITLAGVADHSLTTSDFHIFS
jgi:hypothetical protein